MLLKSLIVFFVWMVVACSHSPVKNTENLKHGTAASWFPGSVEEAFEVAEAQSKHVFLYWGAIWCPPCNELKSQVFSKEKFANLMNKVIPIYLDGDSEAAQNWGERLNVHGYPTMLVLSPKRKELMRLSRYLDIDEFESFFLSAISSVSLPKRFFAKASSEDLKEEDWTRLAYGNSYGAKDFGLSQGVYLERLSALVPRVPRNLPKHRVLLVARLMEAASADDEENKSVAIHKKLRRQASSYLKQWWERPEYIYAVRSTLINSAKEIITWAYPKDSADRKRAIRQWKEALIELRMHPGVSVDARLSSVWPVIEFHLLQHPKKKEFPSEIKRLVRQSVIQADRNAQTPFERQSVISAAGFFLRKIGDVKEARELLVRESKRSQSPWYYYASLANLESEQGNKRAALRWSEQARLAAKGRATRLQWIQIDLSITAKLEPKSQRLKRLATRYYETLFTLGDGFLGRNYKSTKKVAKLVKPLLADPEFNKTFYSYLGRCTELADLSKMRCENHFAK